MLVVCPPLGAAQGAVRTYESKDWPAIHQRPIL
jgi:hypothetical protein